MYGLDAAGELSPPFAAFAYSQEPPTIVVGLSAHIVMSPAECNLERACRACSMKVPAVRDGHVSFFAWAQASAELQGIRRAGQEVPAWLSMCDKKHPNPKP